MAEFCFARVIFFDAGKGFGFASVNGTPFNEIYFNLDVGRIATTFDGEIVFSSEPEHTMPEVGDWIAAEAVLDHKHPYAETWSYIPTDLDSLLDILDAYMGGTISVSLCDTEEVVVSGTMDEFAINLRRGELGFAIQSSKGPQRIGFNTWGGYFKEDVGNAITIFLWLDHNGEWRDAQLQIQSVPALTP